MASPHEVGYSLAHFGFWYTLWEYHRNAALGATHDNSLRETLWIIWIAWNYSRHTGVFQDSSKYNPNVR